MGLLVIVWQNAHWSVALSLTLSAMFAEGVGFYFWKVNKIIEVAQKVHNENLSKSKVPEAGQEK